MLVQPNTGGADTPGDEPGPVEGLHLCPLPPCEDIVFPVLHEYFEVVYGPLIGASSMFLARTLARHIEAAGGPVTVSPVSLALEVGLRSSSTQPVGKNSPLAKGLERLAHHRLVQPLAPATLGVATAVPPAIARLLSRLPETTRRRHEVLVHQLRSGDPRLQQSAPASRSS